MLCYVFNVSFPSSTQVVHVGALSGCWKKAILCNIVKFINVKKKNVFQRLVRNNPVGKVHVVILAILPCNIL